MNKPKLVMADIDGTLTVGSTPIDAYTRSVMEKLHKEGVLLGLASGRAIDHLMMNYKEKWGLSFQFDAFIGMNGGQVYYGKEGVRHEYHLLKKETIKHIIEMMEPFHLNPFLYEGEVMKVKYMDDATRASMIRNGEEAYPVKHVEDLWSNDNGKVCMRVREEDMPKIYAYAVAHETPEFRAFKTQTTMLEFMDPRVNKGYGLEKLCDIMKMPLEDVWTFGDEQNDNEMLEKAGWGVCLINGSEETKKCANDITKYPVTEDGFAHYMEEHVK